MNTLANFLRLFSLLIFLSIFQACSNDDEPGGGGIGPDEELSLSNIVGRWGIISTSEVGGPNETLIPCKNTLEIQENGDFLYIKADAGEWDEGRATFNNADSILTVIIDGQTKTFKLLSVSDTGFELEYTDDDGGTIVVGSDEYVKLERADCSLITSADITSKWSVDEMEIKEFEIDVENDLGTLIETQLLEDIPFNMFTLDFRSNGDLIMIDLIVNYIFDRGTFENLDDHNFLMSFDEEGLDDQVLVHVLNRTDEFVTLMVADYQEEDQKRIVTEIVIGENNGLEPLITEAELDGKWSATEIIQQAFDEGVLVDEQSQDNISHNRLTLEFFMGDGEVQFIDLVDDIGYSRGEFFLLDGSNIVMSLGGGEDGEEDYELFHLMSKEGDNISLKSFQQGGEANNGQEGDDEFDLREFEVMLNKNSGDEHSIGEDELIGEWEITELEDLSNTIGNDDEGPQVGMILTFVDNGTGEVTLQGDLVTTFEYEMLDDNNIKLLLPEENDGGGEANEDNSYTIFHINDNQSDTTLEFILFESSRNDEEGGDGGENSGPTNRIVIKKQG